MHNSRIVSRVYKSGDLSHLLQSPASPVRLVRAGRRVSCEVVRRIRAAGGAGYGGGGCVSECSSRPFSQISTAQAHAEGPLCRLGSLGCLG